MDTRILTITSAAHNHGNINIRCCGIDFFPVDTYGGSDKKAGIGKQITIFANGLNKLVKTDIPTHKNTGKPRWIFRERKWVKDFVRVNEIAPGDQVKITRFNKGEYLLTKIDFPRIHINNTFFKKELSVLSLFSGCGGMDLGLEGNFNALAPCINEKIHKEWIKGKNGNWIELKPTVFKTVFANDILDSARKAWILFFRKRGTRDDVFVQKSIVDLVKEYEDNRNEVFPKPVDIVTGGFPCQDFSNAGKRKGFNSHRSHNGELREYDEPTEESRGTLYIWMRKVINIIKPKVFIAENVKALTTLDNVRNIIESDFKNIAKSGYIVISRILNAVEYGVPQTRERIFFIGFLKSSLRKSILSLLSANEIPIELDPFPILTHKVDNKLYPNYLMNKLKQPVTAKQALIDLPEPEDSINDLSQATLSCAKYYGRHCQGNIEIYPNAPGPTIRAEHHGNIEFRRLSLNHGGRILDELKKGLKERRLTVRECARLQTFPDYYEFVRQNGYKNDPYKISGTEGYVLVGNAVPPLLSYHIATRLQELWPIYFNKE